MSRSTPRGKATTRATLATAIALLLLVVRPVLAQGVPLDSIRLADTTLRHAVSLRDGTTLIGRIVAVSPDSVRVQLAAGEVSVARTAVVRVRQFDGSRIRNGEYWFENPHATRLLFSSTAFPLERGSGYYSNTWLFLHTFAAGVTDRFTLGGGFSLIPGIAVGDNVFYLLPKYTMLDRPAGKVALGALVGLLPFNDRADNGSSDTPWTAGLLYGVGTVGDRDSNLSLGLGWGYAGDELARNPIVMLGGQVRVLRRLSLISENWFFPVSGGTEGLVSWGIRLLSEGLTADVGWVTPLHEDFGFPWLGFAFRF